mmetsp:Transcript_4740/g.7197  ORF Transcript_4740/g.7197 Transcript_4740/m.7197 type:complete len:340 (+) Transcript_4740:83-1102(+)
MKLRVLCLHDSGSSAIDLIAQLQKLGERLHKDNNIELAFVNSPNIKRSKSDQADSDRDDFEREWYCDGEKKVGLDASILHLRQIWTRSLYSNPFHGVLGIGQGAAIASLLPLLRYENPLGEDKDGEQYNLMFEGLHFGIFINGWDELQDNINEGHDFQAECGIPSLHILSKGGDGSCGHRLFCRYGGKSNESKAEKQISEGKHLNAKTMNILGKFLVKQKKVMVSIQRKISIVNSDCRQLEPDNSNEKELDAVLAIEATRKELARVEREALELIHQTVSENPPKALMAMIMPDSQRGGTIVGGWAGDRDAFRSKEFIQSGGAPCPKEFILPSQERAKEP